jgi:hypothetical protein
MFTEHFFSGTLACYLNPTRFMPLICSGLGRQISLPDFLTLWKHGQRRVLGFVANS